VLCDRRQPKFAQINCKFPIRDRAGSRAPTAGRRSWTGLPRSPRDPDRVDPPGRRTNQGVSAGVIIFTVPAARRVPTLDATSGPHCMLSSAQPLNPSFAGLDGQAGGVFRDCSAIFASSSSSDEQVRASATTASTSVRSLRNPPEHAVVLSTIHSAKGLEWDTVFLVGMEDERGSFMTLNLD
jgi:UvrD-like helicase C-terminal domain